MFQIKKKWSTLKSSIKCMASQLQRERAKTGGGSADASSLTPAEERVIGIIGEESIVGIDGSLILMM